MTLKEKLAKAKLVNKYTIERDFYLRAAEKTNEFTGFYGTKAVDFQVKLDALEGMRYSK